MLGCFFSTETTKLEQIKTPAVCSQDGAPGSVHPSALSGTTCSGGL